MKVEDLVVKYAEWINKRARKYFKNEIEANDLAGETIYKCLCNSKRFDCERSFKPWVAVIMENTFKTLYNRKKCVLFSGYEETMFYPGNDYSDQLSTLNNILSIIRECNRKSCCIASVLLYAKGYSYDEISVIEKIPVGTVRSRIAAGRKMLSDVLDL